VAATDRGPRGVTMDAGGLAAVAAARVDAVADSTEKRYRLAAAFYDSPCASRDCRPYAVAELSFLRWEIGRGVLNEQAAERRGSPWWRAINHKLLCDKVEAELLADASNGAASSRNVALWLEFMRAPSAASWYRAHNASIVAGYLEQRELAARELVAERFMMNVALIRVLFAHALAAAPRLALGLLAPMGRPLGDPRRRWVRLFLDLRNQFPESYPLEGWSVDDLTDGEATLPRALDTGIIASRVTELYEFAAGCLGEPRMTTLINDGMPCYSWPPEERDAWRAATARPLARAVALATGRRHPSGFRTAA
jgi:hypothetical protein